MATLKLSKKDTDNLPNRSQLKVDHVLLESRQNYNELMDAILAINETLRDIKNKLEAKPDGDSVQFNAESITKIEKTLLPQLKQKMSEDLNKAKGEVLKHVKENTDRLVTQEGHSRRKNVIINGKVENPDGENTEEVVRKFLVDDLKMEKDKVDKIILRDTHRLATPKNRDGTPRNVPKPIIVAFVCQKDRNDVMRSAYHLKGSTHSMKSDLPKELNDIRSAMLTERTRLKTAQPTWRVRVGERGYKPVLQKADGKVGETQRVKWVDIPLPQPLNT